MNETSIAEFGSTIFESGFLNFLISSAVSWEAFHSESM